MGHAELTLQSDAATRGISLDEYWMPFTPNRDFKHDPKMVVRAEGMYYWNDRGDQIIDARRACSAARPDMAAGKSPRRSARNCGNSTSSRRSRAAIRSSSSSPRASPN